MERFGKIDDIGKSFINLFRMRQKYAYNYNPAYISYAAQHADCTNFLHHRQCMQVDGRKNYEWMGEMMWPRLMLWGGR